jgi:hypothetical protein
MLAKHALSQLSYGPILGSGSACRPNVRAIRRGARSALRPCGPIATVVVETPRAEGSQARLRARADARESQADGGPRRRLRPLIKNGGPGTTRTSDLTLIRGAL